MMTCTVGFNSHPYLLGLELAAAVRRYAKFNIVDKKGAKCGTKTSILSNYYWKFLTFSYQPVYDIHVSNASGAQSTPSDVNSDLLAILLDNVSNMPPVITGLIIPLVRTGRVIRVIAYFIRKN